MSPIFGTVSKVPCSAVVSDPLAFPSLSVLSPQPCLRAYGDWCFTSGQTLSGHRQPARLRSVGSQPFLNLAWEIASRWEAPELPECVGVHLDDVSVSAGPAEGAPHQSFRGKF
ncbi:unnamed protein product [Symbiodinium sp. CCMP2456]|nr:unnamed protein product [Symbiodinium sp. CCMP2456]